MAERTTPQPVIPEEVCFKVCVDGGLRGVTGSMESRVKAAMGIAIYCRILNDTSTNFRYEPIYYSATWLEGVASAFHCEVSVLERAFDEVMRFVVRR